MILFLKIHMTTLQMNDLLSIAKLSPIGPMCMDPLPNPPHPFQHPGPAPGNRYVFQSERKTGGLGNWTKSDPIRWGIAPWGSGGLSRGLFYTVADTGYGLVIRRAGGGAHPRRDTARWTGSSYLLLLLSMVS